MQNPQPHVSIAWALGNLKAEIESAVRDVLVQGEDGDGDGDGDDDDHPATPGECARDAGSPQQHAHVQHDGDYTFVSLARPSGFSIRFWKIVALAGHKVIPLWTSSKGAAAGSTTE